MTGASERTVTIPRLTGNREYMLAVRGAERRVPERKRALVDRAKRTVDVIVGSSLRNGHVIPVGTFQRAYQLYAGLAEKQLRLPRPYARAMIGEVMQGEMHRQVFDGLMSGDAYKVLGKVQPVVDAGLYPADIAEGLRLYARYSRPPKKRLAA